MLNANKVSEIKIIIDGLLKDIESLSETEMISHIKWEELIMSASIIIQKLTTLRIEQERNYMKNLKEEAQRIFSDELRRSLSNLNVNVPDITSVTLEEREPEVIKEPEEDEIEFEFISESTPILDAAKGRVPEWMKDIPGPKVDNIHMAITLNDKLYFIKELFKGDEDQFRLTIQRLNEMATLKEALEFSRGAFPEWDEESAAVYRFYMILRRRFDV
jgi:hypothetical protein